MVRGVKEAGKDVALLTEENKGRFLGEVIKLPGEPDFSFF